VFFLNDHDDMDKKNYLSKKNHEDQFHNSMLNGVFEVKNLKGTKKNSPS